jgi:DNA-binding NarL/FixJ family response regulator
MTIRVCIVDDHQMFREAVREALSRVEDFTVVGEGSDASAARAILEESAPDVAIIDLSIPGAAGLNLLRELSRGARRTRFLVLSMHAAEDFAAEALTVGAAGYVNKAQPISELTEAIRTVASGGVYLPPSVATTTVARYPVRGHTGVDTLSARERDVFQLVVEGRANKEIAAALGVSSKTVETHRANINRKLGVHSTGQLVRYAAVRGLVTESDPGVIRG